MIEEGIKPKEEVAQQNADQSLTDNYTDSWVMVYVKSPSYTSEMKTDYRPVVYFGYKKEDGPYHRQVWLVKPLQ